MTAFFADLDYGKVGSPPDMAGIWTIIGEIPRTPRFYVHSGHGLQPYWPVTGPEFEVSDPARRDDIGLLFKRWGAMIGDVADRYGWKVDNVYELARVLRVPGSVNRKGKPVRARLEVNGGNPMTYREVCELLDEHERNSPRRPAAEKPWTPLSGPDWNTGPEGSTAYGATALAGLLAEDASARHPWAIRAVHRVTELAAQGDLDLDEALDVIEDRFNALIDDGKRDPDPGEFERMVTAARAKHGVPEREPEREPDPEPEQAPEDDDFWTRRPELTAIRARARARRASPYATLGEVFARVICRMPPGLQLPAIVGGNGSLNMLIASVGASGDGKGAAAGAASGAVRLERHAGGRRPAGGLGRGPGQVLRHRQDRQGIRAA